MNDTSKDFYTKVNFLESEWKAKMKSEKSSLSSCNYVINNDHAFRFTKPKKVKSRMKKWKAEVSGSLKLKELSHGRLKEPYIANVAATFRSPQNLEV
jgi:hypothetical protein